MGRLAVYLLWLGLAVAAGTRGPDPARVLFVCEHGSVKSAMAALMLERLAHAAGDPLSATARGITPDAAMPATVREGLAREGIDASDFQPRALTQGDIDDAAFVVTIGTELPRTLRVRNQKLLRWDDVPAATQDYAAASASLRSHLRAFLDALRSPSR